MQLRLANTTLASQVWIANNPWARAKGLLGRSSFPLTDALWIKPCNNIHTFFMKFPIDAVFTDRELKVRRVIQNLRPGRIIWPVWSAHSVFEFAAGFVEKNPVREGDQLYVVP